MSGSGLGALLGHLLPHLSAWEGVTAAIDLIVVYYLVYRVLLLVKGTRGAQMLTGLVLVALGLFAAKLLELSTLTWLLDNFINYSIIFLIVIFQQDIRRGLTRVGGHLFGGGLKYAETTVFEEVVQATEQLAHARIGALIVLERDAELEEFFRGSGELIDARVSKELLVALFLPHPENTVHDGAVVVKSLRVQRAGCVLPLSNNPRLDKSLGTRHRAAIGITEETDAVVVVVSEERGGVSLCFGGNIARDLDPAALRQALLGLFQKPRRRGEEAARPRPSASKVAVRPSSAVPEPTHSSSAVTVRLSAIDPASLRSASGPMPVVNVSTTEPTLPPTPLAAFQSGETNSAPAAPGGSPAGGTATLHAFPAWPPRAVPEAPESIDGGDTTTRSGLDDPAVAPGGPEGRLGR